MQKMIKKLTQLSTFSGLVFAAMLFNILSVAVKYDYTMTMLFNVLAFLTGVTCTIGTLVCSCKVLNLIKANATVTEYKQAEKPAKICKGSSITTLVLVLLSFIIGLMAGFINSPAAANIIYIFLILALLAGLSAEIALIVGFSFSVSRLNHFKEIKDQQPSVAAATASIDANSASTSVNN